jgi:hypothetical protein
VKVYIVGDSGGKWEAMGRSTNHLEVLRFCRRPQWSVRVMEKLVDHL